MSLSSSSDSFDLLTINSNSSSDDEIVWSISTLSDSDSNDDNDNDHHHDHHDDYIVLHRRTPATPTTALPSPDHLASEFSRIVIDPTPSRNKPTIATTARKPAKAAKPKSKARRTKKRAKNSKDTKNPSTAPPPALAKRNRGLGARPIVDDVSEQGDDHDHIPIKGSTTITGIGGNSNGGGSVYEEAVKYMTAYALASITFSSICETHPLFLQPASFQTRPHPPVKPN
jgi:hypothetical protein